MKITIAIPTYNEAQVIGQTIENLETIIKTLPQKHQVNILIIDDHSPDGTQDIVKQKKHKYPNIILLPNQQKAGLGAAYAKAFKYAIDKLKSQIVFEFDADGSHQPKHLPGMIAALDQGADVVVGTRYIKGGHLPQDWGLHRKLLSSFGNFIARIVLFTPQYKDMTSGYRGTKTSYLKKIDLSRFYSHQFAYKIQLYYELHRLGAKIKQFPIDFIDRSLGKSKFPKNNIIDSLRVVFSLRIRDSQKLIKVMIVGGIGTFVQLAFYNLLRLRLGLSLSQNLAIEMAVISNFLLNNLWTFKDNKFSLKDLKKLIIGFVKFNLTSLGSIVIQNLVLLFGVKLLGRSFLIENALVIIGILIGLIWNYLMYTKVVWKTPKKS